MAEYIEREAAIESLPVAWDSAIYALENVPAADVAPVVRCCDCKYHHDCGTHFCDRLGMDCPDDSEFFCKYGARMDGDSDAFD